MSAPTLEQLIIHSLEDSKALDIVVVPLKGKTEIADAMILASGTSSRHISSIAEKLAQDLKDNGHPKVTIEGLGHSDWVLLDALDIIVHVFRPETRDHYALDRMWEQTLAITAKARTESAE
jgi:ribosome-associated protein